MSRDSFTSSLAQMNFAARLTRDTRRGRTQVHRSLLLCLFGVMLLLAACGSSDPQANTEPILAANSDVAVGADNEAQSEEDAQSGEDEETTTTAAAGRLVEIEPYPPDQTAGPVRVQIEEIGLDAPIIAMGWRVDMVDGQRTTVWDVPLDMAGWHINSVGAGGLGNTVISGRQVEGTAVFAPLALGSVAPGQEVLLTDGDGITFVYRIVEVTEPIPVTGATPDELARGASYFEPTTTARLTLVTGWPDFTTTHRIFAVADFVGVLR